MRGFQNECGQESEYSVILLLQYMFDHLRTRVRQSQGIHRSSASKTVQEVSSVSSHAQDLQVERFAESSFQVASCLLRPVHCQPNLVLFLPLCLGRD
jgi:hypothetical protein